MTVPAARPAAVEHPTWCVTTSCDFADGGEHASRAKIVPTDGGNPLLIDLVQRPGHNPQVRLTCGDSECLMPLRSGRTLGKAIGDLAILGRRAEP